MFNIFRSKHVKIYPMKRAFAGNVDTLFYYEKTPAESYRILCEAYEKLHHLSIHVSVGLNASEMMILV